MLAVGRENEIQMHLKSARTYRLVLHGQGGDGDSMNKHDRLRLTLGLSGRVALLRH